MNAAFVRNCPRSIYRTILLFLALALAVAGGISAVDTAEAHSLWIQSGRHQVSEGKVTPLFFCYGHHFPVDDPIRGKKLAWVRVTAPDGTGSDIAIREGKSLHSYPVTYDPPGTHTLTAETTPGYFAMYIDKKGRKRHSLKPMHTFKKRAKEILSSMKSSQWAKTYVVCEKPSDAFPAVAGLPLEIVPPATIFGAKEGDKLSMQIYSEGKPYKGEGHWDATYNGFSTEAEDMYVQKTHTTDGSFVVPVDASGRWFVRFYTKTPAPEAEKDNYLTEKRTATLVFEVRNPRRRPKVVSH